jgi:GNAT superfamily N-acetyltransferase
VIGPTIQITRFAPAHIDAFHALHATAGWCSCVAWWVETWDGWGRRTAEENRALRDRLTESAVFDGYLAFSGPDAVGWCQAVPRDRLVKIGRQFDLAADPGTWAIGCFFVHPRYRRQGIARTLLQAILDDLPGRGARRAEAYPKRTAGEAGELWNGPEALLRAHGFTTAKDDPVRPVLVREL